MARQKRQLWFKAKRYGYGWVPATWQGWAITLLYALGIILLAFNLVHRLPQTPESIIFGFSIPILGLSALFVLIAFSRGEKARFRWGGGETSESHTSRNWTIATLVVLIVICAGTLVALQDIENRAGEYSDAANDTKLGLRSYSNEETGISFKYPMYYRLEEGNIGNEEREARAIVLTKRDEVTAEPGKEPAGEGPTGITIQLFQNNLDKQTVEGWVTGTNNSNYKLANEQYRATLVMGRPALSYSWSGLYEGDSVVFEANSYIVMLTATYIAPEDATREDFWNTVVPSFSVKAKADANASASEETKAKVESYIRANITNLSSIKATMGGTFYVTDVTFSVNNTATVSYEDGHNAYKARLKYVLTPADSVRITSFVLLLDTP